MASKILITPNAGSTTVDPTIAFQGAGVNTDITLRVPSTGGLSFEGTTGQLFSITDSMSGTIFSANDISGIPSIEVLDTGLVKLAQYSGNVVLGSATDTGTAKLQITGAGLITGDFSHSTTGRDVYGPNPSGSGYLYVGGDGVNGITRTASIASVVTTNGNLHLDSGSTAAMYLNYYSGTGGITIGNGASGTNANISAGGVFTGTNFSGPGTGLTGTAASLSIGGSAGSVAWSGVTTPPTTLSGYGITNWKYGNYGSIDLIPGNSGCYYFTSTAGAVIPGQSDGTVWYHAYPAAPTTWGSQLVQDYRTGRSYLRGRNNGAWSAWLTGLDSDNYNSYSPTLTGTGASGSWAINASTATSVVNAGYSVTPNVTSAIRATTPTGYLDFGSMNSSFCHFQTDRPAFYFGNPVTVNGALTTYTGGYAYINSNTYNSYSPTLTGTGASGTWPISVSGSSTSCSGNAASATTTPLVSVDSSMLFGRSGLQYFNLSSAGGDVATTTNTPDANWWHIIRGNHANGAGYYTDLALPMTSAGNIRYRRISAGSSSGWITVLDTTNYNSYSPTLTGIGASGSWAISVTGSSASCTGTAAVASTVTGTSCSQTGDGWWRSTGATGWYSTTYSVGIYATETTNLRTYGAGTNFIAAGNVTAYSDERVKTNWRGFDYDFINQLAQVKSGIYDRTDAELTQVGVSAQSLREVMPHAILEDSEGGLSVAYGNAALAAAIELAKKVVEQEARIARLEALINTLID